MMVKVLKELIFFQQFLIWKGMVIGERFYFGKV